VAGDGGYWEAGDSGSTSYTNWCAGQPDNGGGGLDEDGVLMASGYGGTWHDYSQYDFHKAVIERTTNPAPHIDITAPHSGCCWKRGASYTIKWHNHGAVGGPVAIRLYRGSQYVKRITIGTPNDGSFRWRVPQSLCAASNYRVKIYRTAGSSISTFSSRFRIK